jgi:UDP-glucose 4-epimerase
MVDWTDGVYHLVASVGVRLIIDDPVGSIERNVYGTKIVLRLVAAKKKRILLASSSEVYGKGTGQVPFQEDQDLVLGATSRSR